MPIIETDNEIVVDGLYDDTFREYQMRVNKEHRAWKEAIILLDRKGFRTDDWRLVLSTAEFLLNEGLI